MDSAVFYPGARELVDWLQASGTAVGVVTNKNRPLDRRHPAPGRDCSNSGAGKRPGRQTEAGARIGILLAANSLGLKPEEILYIGDSCTDEAAAAAAGCHFIALTTGATRPGGTCPGHSPVCQSGSPAEAVGTGGRAMTVRHLRIFAAVVDCGTMHAAAQKLYLSQPTITQAIKELEEHYGCLLFERYGRRLMITPAGQELLGHARELLSVYERMERSMKQNARAEAAAHQRHRGAGRTAARADGAGL